MGDRYILTVKCPRCGIVDNDVYYAPTCGFTDHICECGFVIDLEDWTGISHEDCSTRENIQALCDEFSRLQNHK